MNLQCVPSWIGLDDHHPSLSMLQPTAGAAQAAAPRPEFGVTELTWQNGNISSNGLAKPLPKYAPFADVVAGWRKHDAVSPGGDTLEAVVKEATRPLAHPTMPSWLFGRRQIPAAADLQLVPCGGDEAEAEAATAAASRRKRARVDGSQGSSAPGERGESTLMTLDQAMAAAGCGEHDDACGFTVTTNISTSLSELGDGEDRWSPETENTSAGRGGNDSLCHSRRSQRGDGACEEEENGAKADHHGGGGGGGGRSSLSTKRSRVAAVHNESERKRRGRINQKMRTLQKLVPNSSKTDKASMLDEVIEYLKQMQAQLEVMSRMTSMMMPMAMPQALQMSMMAMAQMAQMSMAGMAAGAIMNVSPIATPAPPASFAAATGSIHPPMMPPAAFGPFSAAPWDVCSRGDHHRMPPQPAPAARNPTPADHPFSPFLACQSTPQSMGMDAYSRMAALYQQLHNQTMHHHQPPAATSKKPN